MGNPGLARIPRIPRDLGLQNADPAGSGAHPAGSGADPAESAADPAGSGSISKKVPYFDTTNDGKRTLGPLESMQEK